MVSNSSTTATALRWRARTQKDAVHPELMDTADDSRIHLSVASNEDFSDDSNKKDRTLPFSAAARGNLLWTLLPIGGFSWMNLAIRCSALLATFTSIVSTIGHHKTWFMALHCTTTVTLSVVLLWQLERFHVLQGIRHQVRKTRQAVRRLAIQRDALTQQTLRHEERVAELRQVQVELHELQQTSGKSLQELQGLAHEYKEVTKQMQQYLQQELQQQVLSLVLDSDANGDFRISKKEWKRLRLRLQNTPGMDVVSNKQEEPLILLDDDDDINDGNKDSVNVIDVLRQLEQQQHQQSSFEQRQRRRPSTASSATSVQLTSKFTVRVDPQQVILKSRHTPRQQEKPRLETV